MSGKSNKRSRLRSGLAAGSVAFVLIMGAGSARLAAQPAKVAPGDSGTEAAALKGFAAIHPIDEHAHIYVDNPQFEAMVRDLNLRLLDINLITDKDPYWKTREPQLHEVHTLMQHTQGRIAWCTTFDPYDFMQPNFDREAVQLLNENFANGASAVKMWKNVGMEIKRPDGKYVLPDDPVWKPILSDIATHHKTLVAHIAEPDDCWQPPNPANPDSRYYQSHPVWYAYKHPDVPSKSTILAARDRMLAENPNLRVIGAHLGSMEGSLSDIAVHLDRYPNFAIDTAARVVYLAMKPREQVRAFLIKYQDRIIYGTDGEYFPGNNESEIENHFRAQYALDWRYFATDQEITYRGHKTRGLALPQSVLVKLFRTNAEKWIPGAWGENVAER
jgi:predicted TIM-barrel fold metal-dependent hydrolase